MEIGIAERGANNFEVTDSGIVYHKYWVNIPVEELIIPKDAFIEAFEKYIVPLMAPKETDYRVEANGVPVVPLWNPCGEVKACEFSVKISGAQEDKK